MNKRFNRQIDVQPAEQGVHRPLGEILAEPSINQTFDTTNSPLTHTDQNPIGDSDGGIDF